MKWAGHEAHNGEIGGAYRVLEGRPEERRPLKDPSVNGRVLQRIFKKRDEG
jgi:hypothetical protein